jgi:hypothetical protein
MPLCLNAFITYDKYLNAFVPQCLALLNPLPSSCPINAAIYVVKEGLV